MINIINIINIFDTRQLLIKNEYNQLRLIIEYIILFRNFVNNLTFYYFLFYINYEYFLQYTKLIYFNELS